MKTGSKRGTTKDTRVTMKLINRTRRVAHVINNPVNSLNLVGHIHEREGNCTYDVRNISDIICETGFP